MRDPARRARAPLGVLTMAFADSYPTTERFTPHLCAAFVEMARIHAGHRCGVIPDDLHAEAHQRLQSIRMRLERVVFEGGLRARAG